MTAYVIKDKESGRYYFSSWVNNNPDHLCEEVVLFLPDAFKTFTKKDIAQSEIDNWVEQEGIAFFLPEEENIDPANLTVVQIEWREKGE